MLGALLWLPSGFASPSVQSASDFLDSNHCRALQLQPKAFACPLEPVLAWLARCGITAGSAGWQGVSCLWGPHSQISFTRQKGGRGEADLPSLQHGQAAEAGILSQWRAACVKDGDSFGLHNQALGRKELRPAHGAVPFPFCWQMLEYPGGHLALLVASSHVTSYPGSQATSVLLLVGSLKPLSLNFFSCLKQALLVGVDLTHPVQECGGQMVMKVKWLQRMAGESSISLHWPPLPLPVLVILSLLFFWALQNASLGR